MLAVGSRVRLGSLQAKPELNGKEGFLTELQPANGRWSVRLDDGTTFALKEANLQLVAPRLVLKSGGTSLQGMRESQEDRHAAIPDLAKAARVLKTPVFFLGQPCAYFAVFDGHCGSQCSDFAAKNLHVRVLRHLSQAAGPDAAPDATPTSEQVCGALRKAFEELDAEFIARFRTAKDGSTALVALVAGERLYVAWAGDSRCLLCRREDGGLVAEAASEDHRPSLQSEADRVREAGGEVVNVGDGSWRVAMGGFEERNREIDRALGQGMGLIGKRPVAMAVSRSLGDRDFKAVTQRKDLITASPDVRCFDLDASHAFIVLMSDGVTDAMSNQQIAEFVDQVRDEADPQGGARAAAAALVHEAIQRGSTDNVSAIVCRFEWADADPDGFDFGPQDPPAKRARVG